MASSTDKTLDLTCNETLESSATSLRSGSVTYKPRRGTGVLKPIRRASVIARRRIRGAKLADYDSDEEPPKLVFSEAVGRDEPPSVVVPAGDGSQAAAVVSAGGSRSPVTEVEVSATGSATAESHPVDLEVSEVAQPPESSERADGPSSGAKRIKSGPPDGMSRKEVIKAYLQIYYPQFNPPRN
ncbi:uncharacterized protein LOC110692513 [Chenopodium quinoa]|uniref:uncharacterized protein LOC110692513 n=1 Tax=Chenopodium quinoa TaxID=63459 RepID=UPI000B785C2B|nr:uncharacterized protein LOC110692513 [Chenopodium quinoa]